MNGLGNSLRVFYVIKDAIYLIVVIYLKNVTMIRQYVRFFYVINTLHNTGLILVIYYITLSPIMTLLVCCIIAYYKQNRLTSLFT